ncbi:MAG: hypothetical protein NT169_26395 [Chloroflexi bacterium]|nr:hypothetical protein [Chloroflexota bacterium]
MRLETFTLSLTLAVFAGVFLAWRWSRGPGPADGEIAVGLAGIAPPALVASMIAQGLAFLHVRLRSRQPMRLPGANGFYPGTVIETLVLVASRLVS